MPVADIKDPQCRAFEKLASDPTYKFKRSARGFYVGPALGRDWKWFKLGAEHAEAEAARDRAMWNALVNFCVDDLGGYEAVQVMELWRVGSFDAIREEWPEAPAEMFPSGVLT